MSELTDSQIDVIKTNVDPWLESIESDSDYFKIKRHIVALQTALSDCVRHMTHAGSPDGLVAQVNGKRVLEGKKPRKPEAIIREARR